ncbi:WLM-domain-containing protein [Coniochaeta ligniaria NRRL 30616]|uniref:WLM-domain-containing protein n=1 Tax=Coniochaeta ligniaria NRRL 30616 TaxID=1408157 RepID=A0A1J7IJ34_9PEZI|nr:WLM-domain-containing protein [Coniochaeta ligniaria NRRL 30616]
MADTEAAKPQTPLSSRDNGHHEANEDLPVKITIKFTPQNHTSTLSFAEDATLDELIIHCDELWPDYDWSQSKLMLSSRPPAGTKPPKTLLRASEDGETPLSPFNSTTLKLLAQKRSDISALHAESAAAAARARVVAARKARHHHTHHTRRGASDVRRARDDAAYTFHTVRPLPYLPGPERSLALLERLKDDAGIRAAMRKHKFSVGLLTEMDPAAYTEANHEGTTRILGLNRNQGEVIELRLRTDAGDGYRDYGTIRKTLCHELAHNVHGPHDRDFWDLCHQIEREVATSDWKSGGRTVADGDFAPERPGEDEEEVADHGAWTGGSYVLGSGSGSGSMGGAAQQRPMDRREILARAAEARMRNMANASAPKDPSRSGSDNQSGGQGSA